MTTLNDMPALEESNDAALVAACLGGSKAAYGQIVERYQRLLCSLAYASLGNMSESEDAAQDAFIEGWRKLRALREPEKLRSWLCGILRFKVSHRRRKESRGLHFTLDYPDKLPEARHSELQLTNGPRG